MICTIFFRKSSEALQEICVRLMKFKSLLHDNIFSKKVLAFVVWLSWFPLVQTKKENDKFCLGSLSAHF